MHTNIDLQTRDWRIGSAARLNEARDSSSVRDEAVRSVSASVSTGLRWYDRVVRPRGRNPLPTAHCVQRQATRAPLLSTPSSVGNVSKTWQFRICDFLGKHFPSPCGSVAVTVRTLEEETA